MSIEKDNLNLDPVSYTVSSKRKPKTKVPTAALSRPATFTFTDGAIAGAIKFIKAGDSFQFDGKMQKYENTKITIQTVGMDKAFNLTREIYLALFDALADPVCSEKIAEWNEE